MFGKVCYKAKPGWQLDPNLKSRNAIVPCILAKNWMQVQATAA
ncbi:hypothetical protein [Nostoc sp. DSM 114161]